MKQTRAVAAWLFLIAVTFSTNQAAGQTRDEKVLGDRENLKNDTAWYYDDLELALDEAKKTGKPLMVVLRCIP